MKSCILMKFSVYTIFVFCSYYCRCTMNAHSYLLGCCSRACLWSWCRGWSWWPEGWWREQWSSRDHRSIQSCDSKMEYSLLSPTQYHHCNGYKMELLQCQALVDIEEDNILLHGTYDIGYVSGGEIQLNCEIMIKFLLRLWYDKSEVKVSMWDLKYSCSVD